MTAIDDEFAAPNSARAARPCGRLLAEAREDTRRTPR